MPIHPSTSQIIHTLICRDTMRATCSQTACLSTPTISDAVDDRLIPVGEPMPVTGTGSISPAPRPIGQGYDHTSCCVPRRGCAKRPSFGTMKAAERSGFSPICRRFSFTTAARDGWTCPVQRRPCPQRPLHALYLETQYARTRPIVPMPSCILRAGEHMRHETVFKFGVFDKE